MPQRSVATNYTFEQQRTEINNLAADFWSHKATVDGASSTYLKHDGSNDFTGGTLAVPNAFTINANSGAGTLTISGNLNVTGTTTTVNTTNLDVTDKNITIAKGNTSDATADGAGITIDSGTDITWNFVDANDAWVSSIGVEATTFLKGPYGQFTGSGTPTTGQGVQINAPDANTGQITSYDHTNTAYKQLNLKGSSVGIYTGTSNSLEASFNSTGLTVEGDLINKGSGVFGTSDATIAGNGNLVCHIDTNKNIAFNGAQSEVGNVPALVAFQDSGALTDVGFRGTTVRFANSSAEVLRIGSNGEILTAGVTSEPLYPHYTTARKIQAEIKGALDVGQTRHHGSLAVNCTNSNSFIGLVRSDNTQTDGTDIGVIGWTAYDGTDFHQSGAIMVKKGAGAGNNNQPGHMIFKTNTGAGNATEKLRLKSTAESELEIYCGATDENYAVIRGKYSDSNEYNRSEVRFGVEENANGKGFLAFATGNNSATEALRITAAGKVLVGDGSAISPSYDLEIKGSGTQQFAVTATDASDAVIRLNNSVLNWDFDNDGNGTVGNGAAGTLHLRNSSLGDAAVMSFTATGNVGINNDSPTVKLAVDGGTANDATVVQIKNDSTSAYATNDGGLNTALSLFSDGTDSNQGVGIQLYLQKSGETGAISEIGATRESSGNSNLVFRTRDSGTGVNERMRITSGGRVYIGTTSASPANSYSNNLVVSEASGDAGISIHGNNSNSNYASLYLGDAGGLSRAYLEAQLGSGTGINFTIGAQGDTRFLNNASERLRITKDGHLQMVKPASQTSAHQKFQMLDQNGSVATQQSWGNGNANWEFKHYRTDNQANFPYGNIIFYNGGSSDAGLTEAFRIRTDCNTQFNGGIIFKNGSGHITSEHGIQSGGNATGGYQVSKNYAGKGYNIRTQYAGTEGNGGDPMFEGWWGTANNFRVNTNGLIKAKGGIETVTSGIYLPPGHTLKVNSITSNAGIFAGGFVSKNVAYEEYAFRWSGNTAGAINQVLIKGPSYFQMDVEYVCNQSNSSSGTASIQRVTKGQFANNYVTHTWNMHYQEGSTWTIASGGATFGATDWNGAANGTGSANGLLSIIENNNGGGSYEGSSLVLKIYYCSGNIQVIHTKT